LSISSGQLWWKPLFSRIRIDVEKMTKVASDPKYKWSWPKITLPDGSIADY
jgi:hypothetical protein